MKIGLASRRNLVAATTCAALVVALGLTLTSEPQVQAATARANALRGTVTDATTGQPVAGVDIGVAQSGSTPSAAAYTITSADGTYTITGVSGTVNVAASRYTVNGTPPALIESDEDGHLATGTVNFALQPFAVPGQRTVPANRAKNVILVDMDHTYEECWFQDTKCGTGNTANVSAALKTNGMVGTSMWTSYG